MKTFAQHPWMMNYKFLLGLYCIISVYCLEPTSANSMPGPTSPVTEHPQLLGHKLSNHHLIASVSRRGKTVEERVDRVPDAASAETAKSATETAQNNARASLTNVISPKIPAGVRSVIKRSVKDSIFHGSKKDFTKMANDCDDDASFCNNQVFGKDDLQQMTGFKLHHKMPWDDEDYNSNSYYSDERTHVPGLHHRNLGLPDQRIWGSGANAYHAPSYQEDMDRAADAYRPTHRDVPSRLGTRSPEVTVVSLHKPGESLAVNTKMRQDSPPMPDDNVADELEPIQEEKKNIFTSRGWGAGGMPFNILYMHQQQQTKPPSRFEVAGAQQLVASAQSFPTASQQYRQVAVRNAMGGGAGTVAPAPTRRQYSIIPQLYVSYGWGPQGK